MAKKSSKKDPETETKERWCSVLDYKENQVVSGSENRDFDIVTKKVTEDELRKLQASGKDIWLPVRDDEKPLRELPKGMNKFNSTNEFLILILESLYRIERKMGA